ncbi:hypothetical protein L1987_14053 [Smallanthus sonchifolius]|uniref:Uncharacterized protein n=1 Tax=Smallanthus sonchifolius TaxID=185202 RepID=A0ACB9JKB0_9ASTR|nr:hypothetical protein L1987_14053 [Smallanthus sonchifolius]
MDRKEELKVNRKSVGYEGSDRAIGNKSIGSIKLRIHTKQLQLLLNTFVNEWGIGGKGWDHTCYVGLGWGRDGTKCTHHTTTKRDGRSSKMEGGRSGVFLTLAIMLHVFYLIYRWHQETAQGIYWCMGGEACMQFSAKGLCGEGVDTKHTQITTLKREERRDNGKWGFETIWGDIGGNGLAWQYIHSISKGKSKNLFSGLDELGQRGELGWKLGMPGNYFDLWQVRMNEIMRKHGSERNTIVAEKREDHASR